MRDADFELPADDLAFIALHGTFGEDGQVQKILEDRGVAYTGENAEGSRIAFDKILSKEKFEAQKVTTPDWEILTAGQRPSLGLPFVIKPPRQGSTVGVQIVKKLDEIDERAKQPLHEELPRKTCPGGIDDRNSESCSADSRNHSQGGFYDFKNKYPFLIRALAEVRNTFARRFRTS